MPKQVPENELTAIAAIIAKHPEGIRAAEIVAEIPITLEKRTMQRRLERLIGTGIILASGSGTGKRYFPNHENEKVPEHELIATQGGLTLSDEAKIVKATVSRPQNERNPVGYQPNFLKDYLPNQTFYLKEYTRRQLADMGQVGISDLPAGTYVRQIMDRLLIDLSWNSSRLEGNTYSLLETQRLLELGESAAGKDLQETQMILNHKEAFEMLADQAGEIGFNRYTICNLHALLSNNLLPDASAGGRVRLRPVGITGTVYHPLEVPAQVEEYYDLLLSKAEAIEDPFEQSFFSIIHLPYLQTFEDVNKRTSRLAANIPLIRHNFCPLSFIDVDQDDYTAALQGVYELNRVEYLRDVFTWAYARSCARYAAVRQSLGDPDPFRLRHRNTLGQFVREIVRTCMDKQQATSWIVKTAREQITEEERTRFTQVVEDELDGLHEGNIARYRLLPAEFRQWESNWK